MRLRALRFLPPFVRRNLVRRSFRFREDLVQGLSAQLATNAEDALAAARLVHDAYVARKLIAAHPSGLRVTPSHALPSTFVLVAKREGAVIGTISLQVDGAFGVPMESAFGAEIASLRAEGRRIAEVGALSIAPEHRGVGVVHLLNRAMFEVARAVGVDDLVMAVSDWAADLYETTLCFERMGDVRPYPGLVRSVPAAAMRLSLAEAPARFRAQAPETYAVYVQRPWSEVSLPAGLAVNARPAGTLDGVRALVSARRDVFHSLERAQTLALRRIVPEIYWPTPSQVDPRELYGSFGEAAACT